MSRGVTKNEIARWKIGYCDEGDFAGRIIIPSSDMQGDVNYFVARSYDREWPRYLNPQNVDKNIIFNELFLDFDSFLCGIFVAKFENRTYQPAVSVHARLWQQYESDDPNFIYVYR